MYTKESMSDLLEDLGKNTVTKARAIAEILDIAVTDFENAKRRFDGFSDATKSSDMSIRIPGIRENTAKRIYPGRILVSLYVLGLSKDILNRC